MRYWQFVSVGLEPPLEMIPVEKSEQDEGTSEQDEDEEVDKDFLDPGRELVIEYERDRNNTPICKLVLATASNLKWDRFTGPSTKRK